MQISRREFMSSLGVVLASMMLAGCKLTAGQKDDWDRVRDAWAGLKTLAKDAQDLERGQKTLDRLIADHQAAVDALVQAGQLESTAADDMHTAFSSAAGHVWRANAPITCYLPSPYPMYGVESAANLAQQAEVLADMASRSGIDPATVAQAQAAIQQDMAFLALSGDQETALMEALKQAAGGEWKYPTLAELKLDTPPDVLAAAETLVDVLLGKK